MSIAPLTSGKTYSKTNSITRVLKSYYYASRPVRYAKKGAPDAPLITKVRKFFTALYYANK